MALLGVRNLLPFPPGDNLSDTFIERVHYNLTTLKHWNYTYYSNNTLSNGSFCFLLFEPYTPILLSNGTFLSSTSCYSPINPIESRAKLGIFFACFFTLTIIFTFINLRKHGRHFLPPERRFPEAGRRWQWYWMLTVAAFGMISGITGVDVDRYYLPELPMVLSTLFWFLMLPTTMCVVWESVRHWGSWQERQKVDSDPFILREDDTRSKVELYLPLLFYFFAWMNIFLTIPRSWSAVEYQRDPNQTRLIAEPSATDLRFKVAAFFLFGGWITTLFSLRHSIKHYKDGDRELSNCIIGLIKFIPPKFLLTLPLALAMIGYEAACAFNFSVSPLKLNTSLGFMYGLGWVPIATIFIVYEISGYLDPNEDRELIRQRTVRDTEVNREIGITKKRHWWSTPKSNSPHINVSDIGGGDSTSKSLEGNIETGNMPVSTMDSNKPVGDIEAPRGATSLLAVTQHVRSMLDV